MENTHIVNRIHYIRSHLNVIKDQLWKLIGVYYEDSDLIMSLYFIDNYLSGLSWLVDEVYDYKRITDNYIESDFRESDIVSFIQALILRVDKLFQKKKSMVQFISELSSIPLYFDPIQLDILFFHIISNAYSRVESESGIRVEIIEGVTHIRISIIGDYNQIDAENLEYLFQNDFGTSNTDHKWSGMGFDQFWMKSIIEKHQGEIRIESSRKKHDGSFNIRVKINLLKVRIPFNANNSLEKTLICDSEKLGKKNSINIIGLENENIDREIPIILLAEQSIWLRQFIVNYFGQYHIIECNNGVDAWASLHLHLPSLMIVDGNMIGINGNELYKEFKQDKMTSHIPLVVLKSGSLEVNLLSFVASSTLRYVTKPLNIQNLEVNVEDLLRTTQSIHTTVSGVMNEEKDAQVSKSETDFLNELTVIIQDNVSNPLFTVDFLAKKSRISRTALYAKIKSLTGLSANDFVKRIRINMAVILLTTNQYNVNEVSEMVGFRDRRYFSREFARVTSKLPSYYTRQHKKTYK